MKLITLGRQFRLWTLLLVVVPSLLIMIIYTIGQISIAKQQNLARIHERVVYQKHLIDYWMSERSADIHNLSQLPAFRMLDSEQMQYAFAIMQKDDQNFDSLNYIDKDGLFKISTLSTGIKFPSAVGKPYFEAGRKGEEYISGVVIGRNSGQPIINFSTPIYDYNSDFMGVILGSVRTTTLELLLQENWVGQTGEIFLVNREGVFLTEPRMINTLIEKKVIDGSAKMKLKITEDAAAKIQLGDSGTAEWIDHLGNNVLGAYLDVPEYGWTIIGKIDEKEVLMPIYRQLAEMAAATVVMVIIILPLATLLTNQIKRPIEWLSQQAAMIADDNYKMAGAERFAQGVVHELFILCNTFVAMSRKIESTVSALRDNEAKLESKVEERTLALSKINKELQQQLALAQEVQRSLLPKDYQDEKITIRAVFKPFTIVSGDLYGYRFTRDETHLNGFLLDVTGHGVAAALHTAAISSIMNELIDSEQAWSPENLKQLNLRLVDYFKDDNFVAVMVFTLNLATGMLTITSCGINYFLAATSRGAEVVPVPGIFLGITKQPAFDTVTLSVQKGDKIYFMTDGLYDDLPKCIVDRASHFDETVVALEQMISDKNPDDCTALCIHITGLND